MNFVPQIAAFIGLLAEVIEGIALACLADLVRIGAGTGANIDLAGGDHNFVGGF